MKGFIKTDAIDGWIDKGNEIPTETILDLWNIVESNRI